MLGVPYIFIYFPTTFLCDIIIYLYKVDRMKQALTSPSLLK